MEASYDEGLHRRREKRKRKKIQYVKNVSLKNYIPKCLKSMIRPNAEFSPSISEDAAGAIGDILVDTFHQIMNEAKRNMMRTYKRTLMEDDVQFAVLTCLNGEVARHAVAEGRKAVDLYLQFGRRG